MVVGIDTAGRTASVALVENGRVVSERTHPDCNSISNEEKRSGKNNHAETILPLIQALLEGNGVSLEEITGFALSNGPGSFTGLRIGLSTVKGLAYGSNLSIVGVSTLLAHAARVTNYDGLICALLDARKNEVYAGVFRKSGPAIDRVMEDTVGSIANMIAWVQDLRRGEPCLIVGDGGAVYKNFLWDLPGIVVHDPTNDLTIAATVARLAEARFRSDDVDDLGKLTPVYVRPFEAGI
ncbi:MAG TPA: tRNA (adenosine(37)-N6)-threonylcarbamoyltransferase complex dimerization subunit type 1 TsaB [Candidatus Binatia bacterium]|jgi:tRNA threonylcarbamoyladenosine biosynthesis protein TsaB